MVVELQTYVKQSDIVAASNTIQGNFVSLSSSCLVQFGFVEGLPFLNRYAEDEDNYAPTSIDMKLCDDPSFTY